MKSHSIENHGIIYFENEFPHSFLHDILKVIEEMQVKKTDWYFIVLFTNSDVCFNNILGIYQNIIYRGKWVDRFFPNTPQYIGEKVIEIKRNGIENISFISYPQKILSNRDCCLEESIHFFWHFIHEIQHLFQDEQFSFNVSKLHGFLRKYCEEEIELNSFEIQLKLPLEVDAERKAKQMVVGKFKEEGVQKYLDFRIKHSQEGAFYFNELKKIKCNEGVDTKMQLKEMLISERECLQKTLKKYQSQKKFIDVNIDMALDSLN